MEDLEVQPKTKRRKHSKKNKRDWRKYSDIKDVEDFLEEQRVQERTGGLVAEKDDTDLFIFDTGVKEDTKAAKPRDKYAFRKKPLRTFQNLEPDPRIPPVPKAQPRGDKRHRADNLPHKILRDNGILTPHQRTKLLKSLADRKKTKDKMDEVKQSRAKGVDPYDLWGEGPKNDIPARFKGADEHFMKVTKRKRVQVPGTYRQKANKIAAVELPDSGASYNPSFEDHQDLLRKVYEDELRVIQQQKKIEQWSKGFKRWKPNEVQEIYLKEMSVGLFDNDQEEGAKKGDQSDDDDKEVRPPNPPMTSEGRKTKQQRRKQALVRGMASYRRLAKLERIRENDVYRVKSLRRQIAKEQARIQRLKLKDKQKKMEAIAGTKRLGRTKFEDAPVPFKLSTELTGTLRELKPEGNFVRDRFKNFQKRNLIEARAWQRDKKNKRNLKDYTRKTHKEPLE